MNTPFIFSKTVIGYSHILKNTPTEDASGFYADPDGRYHIAIISDGHGDKNCFRSTFGSKAVVESAMKNLKIFAEKILKDNDRLESFLYDKNVQQRVVNILTNAIFTSWNEAISKDLYDNPPTEEEYAACAPNVADMYRAGKRTAHIYGATLISAVKIKNCLLLLQQGDGRCDVFYADGTVNQPIPWDDRCHENVTTSMCDTDAPTSIRHCVIDTDKTPVIACYVGSDGVEDSFPDNDEEQLGTHRFYKELTCHIIDRYEDYEAFGAFLDEHFSTLSKIGSADDVSVSGIVFVDQCKPFYEKFKTDAKLYELDYKIRELESKIAVMGRKHSILEKRMLNEERLYISAFNEYPKRKAEIDALEQEVAVLTAKREEAERIYLENKQKAEEDNEKIKKLAFFDFFKDGFVKISDFLDGKRRDRDSARKAESRALEDLKRKKAGLIKLQQSMQENQQKYEAAKDEFTAYDETRKTYEAHLDALLEERKRLLTSASSGTN